MSGVAKNIVLVHGAFADGSCWSKVIPLLEEKGYHAEQVFHLFPRQCGIRFSVFHGFSPT